MIHSSPSFLICPECKRHRPAEIEDGPSWHHTSCRERRKLVRRQEVVAVDGYEAFLAEKLPAAIASGIDPGEIAASLFPFQQAITRWAVKRGRAAIFASTGLGKTHMQLEWARQIGGNGLILAPLAVAEQTAEIAAGMGIEARVIRDQSEARDGVSITNYERLHRFDPQAWRWLVLDESSIIKSVEGVTRNKLVGEWTAAPYRLCCTATPAPNDLEELANHAEFLGVCTRREMLSTYFKHDDDGWRIKGHARKAFHRWLASWACYISKPSDLGFEDAGFDLPPLNIAEEVVSVDWRPDGQLFPQLAGGVQGRHLARRGSLEARVAKAAEIILSSPEQWLVWCGLNDEQNALAKLLGEECVSIQGSDSAEEKVRRWQLFRDGQARVLVTKASIFGWGLNAQFAHRMLFLGLGDSFEEYFQAIRRQWRFGQTEPVDVRIVLSDAESKVVENVWRKEREHVQTVAFVVAAMREAEMQEIVGAGAPDPVTYETDEAEGPGWRLLLGDCCERLKELETGSVALSVHSPPFAQLYTYSASMRDLGNCRDYDDFFEHYRFAARELLRVTMPGRRACVHVQQIAMTKVMQGVIAWRDFRAEVVRLYNEEGWIYHGEVVVDKDPQAQAIRTKSKTLLFVQKDKDSSWSIPAMADYILLFRAPGENPVPVKTDVSNEEWIRWARPIWYGIRESETLQAAAAREERDEKHIAPLQLETVERCVRLWSNKGELVADPFAGIGTTGYVALRQERRFVGIELKPSYWRLARKHLGEATQQQALPIFAEASPSP